MGHPSAVSLCRALIVPYMSQLAFDCGAVRMGNLCHLFDFLYIHIVRIRRAVVHNRRESQFQRFQTGLFFQAVVQMDHHRDARLLRHREKII